VPRLRIAKDGLDRSRLEVSGLRLRRIRHGRIEDGSLMLRRYSRLRTYARLKPYRLKPRRGAVDDPKLRAWIHTQPCIVHGEACGRWVEMHHVGRPRNDRHGVPLCVWLHRTGPDAVTKIGRRAFEEKFNISFEAAIIGLNDEYDSTRGKIA
jgi:hypothetical protein